MNRLTSARIQVTQPATEREAFPVSDTSKRIDRLHFVNKNLDLPICWRVTGPGIPEETVPFKTVAVIAAFFLVLVVLHQLDEEQDVVSKLDKPAPFTGRNEAPNT